MKLKYKNGYIFVAIILAIIALQSCKKIIEVGAPVTSTNGNNVFASDATACAVLSGIYSKMSASDISYGGVTSLNYFLGLSADELTLYDFANQNDATLKALFSNNLTSTNTGGDMDFWNRFYPIIFTANSAIEGLNKSTTLTPSVKVQLLGEAKFIRAFCYFYLINLYGDAPLALTSNFEENRLLQRTSTTKIYDHIIEDLKSAEQTLSNSFVKADRITSYPSNSLERIHPNKWAATALLSRVYLFAKRYAEAENEASLVIANKSLFDTVAVNNVFLKNNKEAIWQLQPVVTSPTANTWEARLFILPSTGPDILQTYPVYLNKILVNSFENNDKRQKFWTANVTVGANTYSYATKYKNTAASTSPTEYETILRLGEQYLIRSEARANQNNLSGAIADLNVIRTRAGLPSISSSISSSVFASIILHERQVELFTEWGHRWIDLKRTATINDVMSSVLPQKVNGGVWNPNQTLFPIPQSEINKNPSLVQNPGF